MIVTIEPREAYLKDPKSALELPFCITARWREERKPLIGVSKEM